MSSSDQRSGMQFFKRALAFFSMAALVACSNFLDDQKKKDNVLEIKSDQFACLNDLPEGLERIANATIETVQIESNFLCLKNSLTFFHRRTKGSFSNGYSTEDIRTFFGQYFLKDNNISSDLANSLMKLKQSFFGGTDKQLTKPELERLIELTDEIKNQLIVLVPHLKVLLFQSMQPEIAAKKISPALLQLQKSAKVLLDSVDIAESGYSINEFEKIIEGFYEFFNPHQKNQPVESLKEKLPLIRAVKNALFGLKAELNREEDWEQSIQTLIQLYRIALTWNYRVADLVTMSKTNVDFLIELTQQTIQLLDESLLMRKQGGIPFDLIDPLLVELSKSDLLYQAVKLSTWIETYKVVIQRVLEGRTDSRGIYSFNRAHLDIVKREFSLLKSQQAWIDSIFSVKGFSEGLADTEFQKLIQGSEFEKAVNNSITGIPLRLEVIKAHKNLIHELQKSLPVKFTDQGKMLITYDQKAVPWTWNSVTRIHFMHALTRGFMLGYGILGDGDLSQRGISEASISQWYEDFSSLGTDLKVFDPRVTITAKRSFKEANYFTFSGNGDEFMSFDESFEFISNLISAGIGNTDELTSLMRKAGCALPEMDVFDNPFLDENCFERELRKHFSEIFSNLEYQSRFVSKLGDPTWKLFYHGAMGAARFDASLKGIKVDTADVRTMVVILHYIENLYVIYDKNKNELVETEELRLASQRFYHLLEPFARNVPFGKDYLIREGFVALVVTGRENLVGFKLGEVFNTNKPVIRIHLLNTLLFLKDKL